MRVYDLQCSVCGYLLEEPKATHTTDCPRCRTTLLIPSRKDWLELRAEFKKITMSDV